MENHPSGNTRRFHLRVFGCQMNFYDGELIRESFIARGYQETENPDEAQVVLFHTCSVRENAEERVHGILSSLRNRKKVDPNLVIGVVGCMADREGEELFLREGHVDIVCGSRHFPQLPSLVDRVRGGEERVLELGEAKAPVDQPIRDLTGRPSSWSAHIAVMRGCDMNCTYCIVPSVRGRVESRSIGEICHEVEGLVDRGVTEIHLLGQTIDSYGRDFPANERPSLAKLLDSLAEVPGLLRVRLITLHPSYVNQELVDAMARSPQFHRFLPIPMQSGSDKMLRAMKRGYNLDMYRQKVNLLRQAMPDLELISDWIVGFPGETKEDHELSEAAMEEFGFLQSYVFQYSPRPGTVAFEIPDDVPGEVKKNRNHRLLALQRRISSHRTPLWQGKESHLLLEQLAKDRNDLWVGRIHNGHYATIPSQNGFRAGQMHRVVLNGYDGRALQAESLEMVGEPNTLPPLPVLPLLG